MSPLETRAWLMLGGMGPPYLVYFALQIACPGWVSGLSVLQRFALLAAASVTHAAVYGGGALLAKATERGPDPAQDERDRTIDARATRMAYYALMTGAVLAGMMLPFTEGGWKVVNATLLMIVLSEGLRCAATVMMYRGWLRLVP